MNTKIYRPTLKEIRSLKVPRKNYIFRYWINYELGVYLTWIFARIPITANQITLLNLVVGLVGILIMSFGGYWNFLIGILIYTFSLSLDYSDGTIAKIKKIKSKKGKYLDFMMHEIHHTLMLIAIGIGVFKTTGNNIYIFLGVFCSYILSLIHLFKLNLYKVFYEDSKKLKELEKEPEYPDPNSYVSGMEDGLLIAKSIIKKVFEGMIA